MNDRNLANLWKQKSQPVTDSFASGGSNASVRHLFVNLSFVAPSEFSVENPARTQSRSDAIGSKIGFSDY